MNLVQIFPLPNLGPDEMLSLWPIIVLGLGGILSIVVAPGRAVNRVLSFWIAVVTVLVAMVFTYKGMFEGEVNLLQSTLVFNPFTRALSLAACLFTLLGLFMAYGHDEREGMQPEIFGLMVFSSSGMILMMSTLHLLFMFVSLEIMSLAIYVLVTMRRTSRFSAEAGLKYFILGGLAGALLLYGSALIFGANGSLSLPIIQQNLIASGVMSPLLVVGLGLVVAGLMFKIGAFPFHNWVPDVYQGASTVVTGFMGAGVKLTAFVALARIVEYLVSAENLPGDFQWFVMALTLLAAASMIYGNIVAIQQTEIKRMLAYSTIAHTGYLLVGVLSLRPGGEGLDSIVAYLIFYSFSNLGAFGVLSMIEKARSKDITLDEVAGLGLRSPLVGACLTLFLLAMAGIPLTSGFIGKYFVFSSAVSAGEIPLVVVAVLTSVISMYYYLRVVVYLYMKPSPAEVQAIVFHRGAWITALVSALTTLQWGIWPSSFLRFISYLSR